MSEGRRAGAELVRFRVVRKETAPRVGVEVEAMASPRLTTPRGAPVERLMVPLPDGAADLQIGDELVLVQATRTA